MNPQIKRNFNILYNNIQDKNLKIKNLNFINDEIKTNLHVPSKNNRSDFYFHRKSSQDMNNKIHGESYKELQIKNGSNFKARPQSTHQRISEKTQPNKEIRAQLAGIFQKARRSLYV